MFLKESEPVTGKAMKVKMFVHGSPGEAEKELGHWMEQHPVRIRHITQSQSEKQGRFVFVMTVFYEALD